MNYSDTILVTEISETTLVFTTNKTLHERFTKKPRRCVFIINNGCTTKSRYNRLKDRVVFKNRKGLKVSKRFSTYDQGNEKGIENKDAGNSSSYESIEELSSITDKRRVVFMPEDFKEDCSTVKHDMKQDDGSDGRCLKHSSNIKSDEHLSTIPENRRVDLMPSDFKEDCATAKHDMEIADGSDRKCLEHSSSNDKSDEDLSTITDNRSEVLMPSDNRSVVFMPEDFTEDCSMVKHDMKQDDGNDSRYLKHSSNIKSDEHLSMIPENGRVVLMPSDFEKDCTTAKHDMEIADGSDSKCLEHSSSNDKSDEDLSTIIDNRSVVLMPSDFTEDCSTARHDIEIADGSDSRCLEHFSSNDKSDEDLITVTDNRSVVAIPSDIRKDCSSEKHDMDLADGSDRRCLEYSSSDNKSVEDLNTISDNRSVVLMPSDFLEDFSKANHDMEEIADGSDGRCSEQSSINYKSNEPLRAITDNKRVVSMPSDFKDDCSIVKHDMEQDDGSDGRCLNHSSSNHKWNESLRTIPDNKRVVSIASNFKKDCPTVKHDSDDAREPIIFKPYMLKRYNRCERKSLSKRSSSERNSPKRSSSKQKHYNPSKKDLDKEIDTYMAEIKFKHIVKSRDSSDDIDSFDNEYMMDTEVFISK